MNKSNAVKESGTKKKVGRPKKEGSEKKVIQKTLKKEIKPENYFYMCDGKVLKDLIELAECMESINHDVFNYHVNDSKNDFSNWIRGVFENHTLADEIVTIREPRQVQVIILKHLAKKR